MKNLIVRVRYILLILIFVIAVGTVTFSLLEGLSLFKAFYFTVVTVATVGYGDIVPTHTASRILALIIIVVGVAAFTGLIVNATQFLVERNTEKQRKARLNMLIELFFSEIGTEMLRLFSAADPGFDNIRPEFKVDTAKPEESLERFRRLVQNHVVSLSPERLQLTKLNELLRIKENLLVRLLESPNLNENESSTDILRATFHLGQELKARADLAVLPATDREHLVNDARRAYGISSKAWIEHLAYLKEYYPYLFSFTLRTNPYSEQISPSV